MDFGKWFWWAVAICLAVWLANIIWYKPFNIDHFYERALLQYARHYPERFSRIRPGGLFDLMNYHRRLDDISIAHIQATQQEIIKNLDMLRSYKRGKQSEAQQISTAVLDWYFEDQIIGQPFYHYQQPANPINGVHIGLINLLTKHHEIRKMTDAEAYLKRLSAIGNKIDQLVLWLQIRQDMGVPPLTCSMKNRTAQQLDMFLAEAPVQNVLYLDFYQKVAEYLPPEIRAELYGEAASIVENIVYPAFQKLADFVHEMPCGSQPIDSLGREQHEAPYYNYMLNHYATHPALADDFYQMGISEVDSIGNLVKAMSSPQRTTSEAFAYLQAKYLQTADSLGYIVALRHTTEWMDSATHFFFDRKNRFEVQIVPDRGFAPSMFPEPSILPIYLDKARGNVYEVNVSSNAAHRSMEVAALVARDIVPGKLYQLSTQRALDELPKFRRVIEVDAYTEGWGHYALYLLNQHGFFGSEPQRAGLLHLQMVAAALMVADVGIHSKGWSLAQARLFLQLHTVLTEQEINYQLDKICLFPGRACAYKAGSLQLISLYQEAKNRLGSEFDLREFHGVVLGAGAVPMHVLTQIVHRYLDKLGNEK